MMASYSKDHKIPKIHMLFHFIFTCLLLPAITQSLYDQALSKKCPLLPRAFPILYLFKQNKGA